MPEYWDQDAVSSVGTPITIAQEEAFVYPTVARYNRGEHFARYDAETLFFTFYYQAGTQQQVMAARELQNKGWAYHQKAQIWYSKGTKQGEYVYFDYAGTWSVKGISGEELQQMDNQQPLSTQKVPQRAPQKGARQ
ncbi:hypothetical protein FGO68_gene6826 [Halteria grandinella]|uniref:NOT2/NOT3/NOT5 C-terminal domain-containing protein n=1 Tax=Halteria grandinella TaxID=5974 RepID=A0A8J8SVV9_HALGN|nr:hypothetical protein FGO68_gene6826 [Halteria grandinella]